MNHERGAIGPPGSAGARGLLLRPWPSPVASQTLRDRIAIIRGRKRVGVKGKVGEGRLYGWPRVDCTKCMTVTVVQCRGEVR